MLEIITVPYLFMEAFLEKSLEINSALKRAGESLEYET